MVRKGRGGMVGYGGARGARQNVMCVLSVVGCVCVWEEWSGAAADGLSCSPWRLLLTHTLFLIYVNQVRARDSYCSIPAAATVNADSITQQDIILHIKL